MNQDHFLKQCQQSSQDAYLAFKQLLLKLENSTTRVEALEFSHHLVDHLLQNYSAQQMLENYHFSFSNLALRQGDEETTHLKLLQLPSTFAPEEWSFTFFEGLARYKQAEFQDRTVTELGCGIGWISIALAKQTHPRKIWGLDINPKAIHCSKINLFLNAFDSAGKPTWKNDGRTLLDVVEFHQSDLLEYCRSRGIVLDRVIGCIPQVLNPDPEFSTKVASKRTLEQANDEFLYSLSNYTADQGYIEDQFGLGLIARAVEESVDVLKVSGKIILNLGGRPGASILNQLFLRRGFKVQPVWQTQVNQAKDTDIHSLVAIEEQTRHRFEFYMGYGSTVPVSAKTALAYAESGGEISHALTVYEGQLRDPAHLPRILQFMRHSGYEDARHSIDLSYPEDSLAIEKMSYLHALTEYLQKEKFFAYEGTSGIHKFRERLSAFFRNYYKIPLHINQFFIAPSRAAICKNILSSYRPKNALPKALVDTQIASQLDDSSGIIEVPRSSDLLCDLIEKLRPEIVIYSIPSHEAETRDSFLRICEVTQKAGSRVFIDISDLVELSSTPKNNGIFRHLVKESLPLHVSLICGLVKNRLYKDLEVCFVISENENLLKALESAGELTYSRTPVLSQLFYDRIIEELINFQIVESTGVQAETIRPLRVEDLEFKKKFIQLSKSAQTAFSHPAIEAESFARDPSYIRLDYGENCLPAPSILKKAIFESYAKMHLNLEEISCDLEVIEIAQQKFHFENTDSIQVSLANGVAPLFSEIASYCAKTDQTLVFPMGSYGHFIASAQFHGANIQVIKTNKKNLFKLEPKNLEEALTSLKDKAWLILSAPIVNPTGSIYDSSELEEIFKIVEKHRSKVILDSIFSGLEYNLPKNVKIPQLNRLPSLQWAILGGISKEFAAGGLRIGYGLSSVAEIQSIWQNHHNLAPHSALKFTLKKIYRKLIERDSELALELNQMRAELRKRAFELSQALTQSGWDPIPSSGGLFMSATPAQQNNLEKMAEILREKTGIIINPPSWTGIPGYFRFVLSIEREQFDEALRKIRNFDTNHCNSK